MAARRTEIWAILQEALLVAVASLIIAAAANAISPRGLSIGRDYFPVAKGTINAPGVLTGYQSANPNAAAEETSAAARLKAAGLQVIDDSTAAKWVADPRYAAGLIVFVDARDEDHYSAGHIPGAFEYDRYHPDKYLIEVLPACQAAEQVVVYCNGGDCEDSEFTALALRGAGVANPKLFVYLNGIRGWIAQRSLVETGQRGSGDLRTGAQ